MNEEEVIIPKEDRITHTTKCEHEWVEQETDPNTGLTAMTCTKCWSGILRSKNG